MREAGQHGEMFHGELHVERSAARRACKCGRPTRSPGQRECRECHAESMRRFREARRVKLLVPEMFRFREIGRGCSYWRMDGDHRVVAGLCRCGRQFVVGERVAK